MSSTFPPIDVSMAGDPVPLAIGMLRKYRVLATVAGRHGRVAGSPRQLVAAAQQIRDAALAAASLPEMILGLWRIEGLVFAFCHQNPGISLASITLPVEAGPPAHCGLAMATVLHEGFAGGERLVQRLDAAAHPAFRAFCFETVGLMAAIYDRDLFGWTARLLGRAGVLRHRPLCRPCLDTLVQAFPAEQRPLLGHGFGRCLYFKISGLSRAVLRALLVPSLAPEACVRGVVAAYTLINSQDLARLVSLHAAADHPVLDAAITGGLLNTLLLLAWTAPGCLHQLAPAASQGRQLLEQAEDLAATARAHGHGPPMQAVSACRSR